jgi:polyisoprenoid-binding protein YceI
LRKGLHAAALALLLAACGAPPPRPSNPHPAAPPLPAAAHGTAYRIDSSHSELRLLVYRAGALAALGHDHVIVNRALEGWVNPAGSAAGAAFFLSIPTSGFVVDEAAARAQEGADFSAAVGDDARDGTLHNMLSPALLDAQNYAAITVQSISIEPRAAQAPPADGQVAPAGMQATLRITVAGHDSSLVLPFTVETSAGRLHALAAFTVQQSALGLTPFTAFLGALRVDDQVRVKLDLLAVRD